MKPTEYFIGARLLPAIICSIPFFVLYFFYLGVYLGDFFEALLKLRWIGDVSVATAFVFLMAVLGRAIAKDVFERYWFAGDETRMPTTEFLLHTGTEYSDEFKARVHAKIRKDFSIAIPGIEDECGNETRARKIIAEAVGQIRYKLKDGRLILQHNIEYGFIRNLVGTSVIAVVVSLLNILIFTEISQNETALFLSLATATLFSLPILLSKVLIRSHGVRYARVLFQEYLSA